MLSFIFTFLINIIDIAGILAVFLCFLAREVKWNVKSMGGISALFMVLLAIGSYIPNIQMVNVVILGLPFALCIVFTGKRFYNFWMLVTSLMFYVLWYICFDYIVEMMLGISEDGDTLGRALLMVVSGAIRLGVLLWIIVYCYRNKVDTVLRGVEILGYYAYFGFSLVEIFMVYMMRGKLNVVAGVIMGILLLLIMAAVFAVYSGYLLAKRRKRQMEGHIREVDNYLDMQMQFIEQDKENRQQMRQLKHDLRNHLQVIQELCAVRDYKAAEKYVESLYNKSGMTTVMNMTGNQVADIVLSAKKHEASERGIEFLCEGEFNSLAEIEPVDVCTIFSNVLDNALEAAEKVTNGKISIQGIKHKNYYILIVTNSIAGPVKIKNNQIVTIKKDKENHGIGLVGVRRTVEKYHGECLLSCENHEFITKVILLV